MDLSRFFEDRKRSRKSNLSRFFLRVTRAAENRGQATVRPERQCIRFTIKSMNARTLAGSSRLDG
jgi:hypothetical protein